MTRKQMGLICTLMALLVCVAVLSLKLNESGLNDPSGLPANILNDETDAVSAEKDDKKDDEKVEEKDKDKNTEKENEKKDQETTASQNTMISLRSSREKDDATAIQNLEAIIDNKNNSQERIDLATEELSLKNKTIDQQNRIENNIKLLGYNDALCLIDSGKAKVYLNSDDLLDESKVAAINEIVEDVMEESVTTTIKITQ